MKYPGHPIESVENFVFPHFRFSPNFRDAGSVFVTNAAKILPTIWNVNEIDYHCPIFAIMWVIGSCEFSWISNTRELRMLVWFRVIGIWELYLDFGNWELYLECRAIGTWEFSCIGNSDVFGWRPCQNLQNPRKTRPWTVPKASTKSFKWMSYRACPCSRMFCAKDSGIPWKNMKNRSPKKRSKNRYFPPQPSANLENPPKTKPRTPPKSIPIRLLS